LTVSAEVAALAAGAEGFCRRVRAELGDAAFEQKRRN